MDLEKIQLSEFLKPYACGCGRPHHTDLSRIEVSAGAIEALPRLVRELGHQKVFLLADQTTDRVAGRKVKAVLEAGDVPVKYYVIPQAEVVPDETAVGGVLMAFDRSCDLVVGVGSGTVNDTSRFLSWQAGIEYFIAATAPSMDGFASTVAPLITNNLKTTYECHVPQAIIADLNILKDAPMHMIAAGFGDILGKYTCLCDWKLSHIINGEYYCETVAQIMGLALRRTIDSKAGLMNRDIEAVRQLTEALILAGIAMSYVGNSRPASGCEHHMSHYWEMFFLFEGRKAVLHGTKVGIGTVAALTLYDHLKKESLDFEKIMGEPVPAMDGVWEGKIMKAFRQAGPEVILLEKRVHKNAPEARLKRVRACREHWAEIQAAMKALPAPGEVEALLKEVGGATRPQDVGLEPEAVHTSILYAKEVRDRYTMLQLLWDLNLIEDYADKVTKELCAGQTV